MHQDLFKDNLNEANCGTLLYKMRDSHIISNPILNQRSVLISENDIDFSSNIGTTAQLEQQSFSKQQNDIIRVVLDLVRNVSETEPSWNDLVQNENYDFQIVPLSMQRCVKHFNLDAKQEAAFNIICSSFMLARLDESENISEDQKLFAKEVLLKKGSTEHLVMNLTGAGGCGKSLVLNASRSMCE